MYYNHLRKLWDEMQSLCIVLDRTYDGCFCGLNSKLTELEYRNRLLRFLMGLNDVFEHVRNQILSMEPLPTTGKAYYLINQVEKHKQLSGWMHNNDNNITCVARNALKKLEVDKRDMKTGRIYI